MKPILQRVLHELWFFAKGCGCVAIRCSWGTVKSLTKTFVIMAYFFYAWACFGDGQPQRLLNVREVWAVIDQTMRNVHDKGCPR